MNLRLLVVFLMSAFLANCAGGKKQPVQTPPPKKAEPADTSTTGDTSPFEDEKKENAEEKDKEKEEEDKEKEDEKEDPSTVTVPNTTTNINSGSGSNTLSVIKGLIPLVSSMASGQMPDISTILGLIPGGGGGALSGLTGMLSGGGLSGLTGLLGGTGTTP